MACHPLLHLAALTADYLETAPALEAEGAVLSGSVADLRALPDNLPPSDAPCDPVRWLQFASQAMGADPTVLAVAARSAFRQVRWTEFYTEDGSSRSFLNCFANGEGIGPDGRLRYNSLILGLFIMGPGLTYPLHAHPAEAFYLVLSGRPAFKVGAAAPHRDVADREVVWHPADIPHSILSGTEPLFAIFRWRGNISAPSWYAADMTDPQSSRRHPKIATTCFITG